MTISHVFNVTGRSLSPLILRGSITTDPTFKLQELTLAKLGKEDKTIIKSETTDKITVTTTQFTTLSNQAPLPFALTLTGTEPGDGTFRVQSMAIGGVTIAAALQSTQPASVPLESDFTGLKGAPLQPLPAQAAGGKKAG